MVLGRGEKRFAISIDQMEAVERIPAESIEPMSAAMKGRADELQWRISKRVRTSQTSVLLDEDFLF